MLFFTCFMLELVYVRARRIGRDLVERGGRELKEVFMESGGK